MSSKKTDRYKEWFDGKKLAETEAFALLSTLEKTYPTARTELGYNNAYELTVAVILSAQCTDKRVNTVTPALFEKYPTPESLKNADLQTLEDIIRPCGFFRNKAKNLIGMATAVVDRFNGEIPDNLADLQTLPGVGRKTANVVYAVGFSGNAIAVDTHVFRVANRMGLTCAKDVFNTEKQLMELLPEEKWRDTHHVLIFHGRRTCHAVKPDCENCSVKDLCKYHGGRKDV